MDNTLIKTRRTRIVNFRVTEEEYARLRSASHALGIHGISGYARHATLHLADGGSPQEPYNAGGREFLESMLELTHRVAELELKVERLVGPSGRMPENAHSTY